ncbi:TWiK family of potassium channels protein 7-like [Glandiceps talaboti]
MADREAKSKKDTLNRPGCSPCSLSSRGRKAFLVAHLVCVLVLVSYLLIGAQIFRALETEKEMEQRKHVWAYRDDMLKELWKLGHESENITWQEWKEKAESHLDHFSSHLEVIFVHGYRTSSMHSHWNFGDSLIFCMSVVTTIGYGHMAPATNLGRFICMVYALLGIPLSFQVIADSSKLVFHSIKSLLSCFAKLRGKKGRTGERDVTETRSPTDHREKYFERNYVHQNESKTQFSNGNGPTVTIPSGGDSIQFLRPESLKLKRKGKRAKVPSDTNRRPREFKLPLLAVVIATSACICLSALYYWWWQGWTYFQSLYFTVVSTSTIGFGDLIPGDTIDSIGSICRLAMYFYINMTGMAVLSVYLSQSQNRICSVSRKISRRLIGWGKVKTPSNIEESRPTSVRQRNYWLDDSDDESFNPRGFRGDTSM